MIVMTVRASPPEPVIQLRPRQSTAVPTLYLVRHVNRRDADPWGYVPPGGESYAMVAARLRPFLGEASGHGKLIIVAHGIVSQVLRGLYGNLRPDEIVKLQQPQDAVFRLQEGTIAAFTAEAA